MWLENGDVSHCEALRMLSKISAEPFIGNERLCWQSAYFMN